MFVNDFGGILLIFDIELTFHRYTIYFHNFFCYRFSENNSSYSNIYFGNIPKFSTFYLIENFQHPFFLVSCWDNYCKFFNNFSKMITERMLFFSNHLRKVIPSQNGLSYHNEVFEIYAMLLIMLTRK